ncbi:MAG: lysostaphin resistance A-like protein [Candidatus Thorarchaeota archaeon]
MPLIERDEHFFNFFKPSLLNVIGLLLLSIGAIGFLLLSIILPILVPDAIIASIQLNLFGQIVGVLITVLFLIPFFGVKLAKTENPTVMRVLKVLGVCCLALTFVTFLALILFTVFTTLGLPIEHSYGNIVLEPWHLANPWNIVLFFATATIGAAIFEELIFRRMLIPLLEMRGMAPTAAVITASLGFAFVHVPNDIINGSLGYVISHFISTFTIGVFLGLIYVFTRNVLFPIILHGFINSIAFTELILFNLGDMNLLLIFAFITLGIWILGIFMAGFVLFQYFRKPAPAWLQTLRIKSDIKILPGLSGYLIVAFGLVSLQVLIELGIDVLFFPNIFMFYVVMFLFYVLFFLVLLWISSRTKYEGSSEQPNERKTHYENASKVRLEPHREEAE